VFPEHIAQALIAGKKVEPQSHACVTIYFSDIVDFTTISGQLSAQEVSEMLDRLYTVFDDLAGVQMLNPQPCTLHPLPNPQP
jgi:class 3 adenylate cyclase